MSPLVIRMMRDYFKTAMQTNYSGPAISLKYSFKSQHPPGMSKINRYTKKIMEIENYPHIFRSFYEALNSIDLKPIFIKLDRF